MGLRPSRMASQRTRVALHRVAELIVAPARKPDNEIALVADRRRLRDAAVRVRGRSAPGARGRPSSWSSPRTAPSAASRCARSPSGRLRRRGPVRGRRPRGRPTLDLDPEPRGCSASSTRSATRRCEPCSRRPPPPTTRRRSLWPEHFDIAIESGPEALGRRANYGASPGDEQHPEPYLYVGPWQDQGGGELWNATAFAAPSSLRGAGGRRRPAALAVEFFTVRREDLAD